MNRVAPLIVFIVTIIVGGMYWALWDDCQSYLATFVVHDVYYELMSWVFQLIPAIILVVAILCLILAGLGSRSGGEVIEY